MIIDCEFDNKNDLIKKYGLLIFKQMSYIDLSMNTGNNYWRSYLR